MVKHSVELLATLAIRIPIAFIRRGSVLPVRIQERPFAWCYSRD